MWAGCGGDELTNSQPDKKKKRKSCRASPGSWLASIILPLLVGRVYKPLPIAKELELKCWHTSCIMWHWSDECSAPKSSTLSLAWAGIWHNEDSCTIWLVSFGSEKKITGLPQLYKGYRSNIMAYNDWLFIEGLVCMYKYMHTYTHLYGYILYGCKVLLWQKTCQIFKSMLPWPHTDRIRLTRWNYQSHNHI